MTKILIEEIEKEINLCKTKIAEAKQIIAIQNERLDEFGDRKTMLEGLLCIAREGEENAAD
ncbi:MAG: hypothetical protein IJN43_18750 [Ruminococcus sp.]|nr:hypothetical protein [Ruminococcus sp.]